MKRRSRLRKCCGRWMPRTAVTGQQSCRRIRFRAFRKFPHPGNPNRLMLRLPQFEYVAARSLDEAATLLASHASRAAVVAGGTDLYPNMKRRQQEPAIVIGLRRIPGMNAIRREDGHIR